MKTITAVVAVGLLSTSSVYAETKTESPIIVTASRTAETVDESLASVTVITRQDILNSQAIELADLLKLEAGIDISKNGGPASTTNVFTRGTNSNHTLFLIDGMRVSSATTGTYAIERLTLNEIERIEVVRGPRATQYGSEAIGGIIHIFTRQNKSQHASIGFGSFNTHKASAGINIGDKVKFNLNSSYEHSQGFSATNTGAGFVHNADDDGYRKNNYNVGLSIPVTKDIDISLKGIGTNTYTEFDQGITNTTGQSFSGEVKQNVTTDWSSKISTGYNYENVVTDSLGQFFDSDITTKRFQVDWQNDITLSDQLFLLVGFTRYEDEAENTDLDAATITFDETIDNNAIFANLNISATAHEFLFSLRNDDHSNFGNHTTGAISWGYEIVPSLRFTTTASNSFRAPTINELYHPGFFIPGLGIQYMGNPNLKPETADGGEISARWKISNQQQLNVTYFSNWISDLIDFQGTNFQAVNIDRARTKGFEIHHQWSDAKWSVITNLTMQRAYDEATRLDLLRRPRNKLSLVVKRQHSKDSSSRFEIVSSSEHRDYDPVTFGFTTVPGYTMFNLANRIKIDKHIWFDMRIDNLTNKQYELAKGYNTPDRSIFIGMSYDLNK